ncbi:hypothetical protein MAR_006855 [Mya arenaria]|uniref:Uncharacterized protein n=1 Tax=Mya arenaria TaxID=6604 RepID=A0ABY7DDB3_MYAAR|nr:hypothetical protein MAR_006855 [Mya arenaria]
MKKNAWSVYKKVAPPLAAAGAAVVAAPLVLSAAGFGPEGIKRESFAANIMSATARSNGKGVPAGIFNDDTDEDDESGNGA